MSHCSTLDINLPKKTQIFLPRIWGLHCRWHRPTGCRVIRCWLIMVMITAWWVTELTCMSEQLQSVSAERDHWKSRYDVVHGELNSTRKVLAIVSVSYFPLFGGKRGDYQNCSVLYCVLKLCTVISTLRWAVLTVLWIGFCHTGPISLCSDSFVFVYVYFVFLSTAYVILLKYSEVDMIHDMIYNVFGGTLNLAQLYIRIVFTLFQFVFRRDDY